jgi:hypothetical protein
VPYIAVIRAQHTPVALGKFGDAKQQRRASTLHAILDGGKPEQAAVESIVDSARSVRSTCSRRSLFAVMAQLVTPPLF